MQNVLVFRYQPFEVYEAQKPFQLVIAGSKVEALSMSFEP